MVVRGTVKNGKVILDDSKSLPNGAEVEVRPARKRKQSARGKTPRKPTKKKQPPRSLAERFRSFIGKAKGLPPDMSVNLDHYLYGLPKQE